MFEIFQFIFLCIFVLSLIGLPFFIKFYKSYSKSITDALNTKSGGEFIDTKSGKPLTENQFQDKMKEFQDILNEEDEDEDLGQKELKFRQLTDEEKEDDKERNWKEIPYKKNYTKED